MDDIFLLVEHSRDLGEVHVLGWFDNEHLAREAAAALELHARMGTAPIRESTIPLADRRYWVKGISRFRIGALTGGATLH